MQDDDGNDYYIDEAKIRLQDGDLYFWYLMDNIKKNKHGFLSVKHYYQVNCKLPRYKELSFTFYKQATGKGAGKSEILTKSAWRNPMPNSALQSVLESVCNQ